MNKNIDLFVIFFFLRTGNFFLKIRPAIKNDNCFLALLFSGQVRLYLVADHGRAEWLGYWDKFVKKASFKNLASLCHIKQNNLTYLGQVCTPCLSVFIGDIFRIHNHSFFVWFF